MTAGLAPGPELTLEARSHLTSTIWAIWGTVLWKTMITFLHGLFLSFLSSPSTWYRIVKMTVILGAKFPFLTSKSFFSYDQWIKTTNAHAIAIRTSCSLRKPRMRTRIWIRKAAIKEGTLQTFYPHLRSTVRGLAVAAASKRNQSNWIQHFLL